jgi:hypothetical protein
MPNLGLTFVQNFGETVTSKFGSDPRSSRSSPAAWKSNCFYRICNGLSINKCHFHKYENSCPASFGDFLFSLSFTPPGGKFSSIFNDMHRRFDTVGCLGICADVCVAIDSGIGHACGDNIGYFRLEWRWLVTADRLPSGVSLNLIPLSG